ncbi:UxaA family hydrolase [Paracandidimonas soli]|uniref:Altronate hydrolase n=1 Tax=Paracandidimonas soli TaxID=1917182 RepID=A0A4R3V1E7_9BURK|nr:UxaA family hydrolase [Paracandidimonas soli]TCU96094.1 altronate hydrolase [Paracandidimonas soli]
MNTLPGEPHAEPRTFLGYPRADGRAGTRNQLGVIIVGNCAATAARHVADHFTAQRLAAYPNVDGVVPFIHELGCGMEKSGEPMDLLRRTLGGVIRNPNIAGIVVMALGCERNNIYAFLEQEGLESNPMLKTVVLQEVGGTAKAVAEGVAALEAMLPVANQVARTPVPVSRLVLGIPATPGGNDAVRAALGVATDLLIADGATVIVSDTRSSGPALRARAATPKVGAGIEQRIEWWGQYTKGRDTGAAAPAAAWQQLGSSPLQAVFGYAHALPSQGLVLMDAPGYEAVAATGQIASGATLACMISADGNPFNAPGVPTVNVAPDSGLYARYTDDMDFDAGPAADGGSSPEAMGERLLAHLLAVASGAPTCGEALGAGENEFVPWPIGVFA